MPPLGDDQGHRADPSVDRLAGPYSDGSLKGVPAEADFGDLDIDRQIDQDGTGA